MVAFVVVFSFIGVTKLHYCAIPPVRLLQTVRHFTNNQAYFAHRTRWIRIVQNAESLCALKVYYRTLKVYVHSRYIMPTPHYQSTLLNAYYRNMLLRHGLSFYALMYGLVEQDELESYSFLCTQHILRQRATIVWCTSTYITARV